MDAPRRLRNTVFGVAARLEGDMVICWDIPGPTWRHELMPKYKAGRSDRPRRLAEALREAHRLAGGVEAPGYEADHLIATLAHEHRDQVYIPSYDKGIGSS